MVEFIIGILVGVFLYWVFGKRKRVSGSFTVNMSDPMDETFQINFYESLGELCAKKHLYLEVKVLTDDSLK